MLARPFAACHSLSHGHRQEHCLKRDRENHLGTASCGFAPEPLDTYYDILYFTKTMICYYTIRIYYGSDNCRKHPQVMPTQVP